MPCITRKEAVHATMAQHRRYWKLQGCINCPRRIWRNDLIKLLKQWRSEGDKIILLLDSNENMNDGQLARLLRQDDLQMKDMIKHRTKKKGPPIFIRGKRQIHGAWMTPDIDVTSAFIIVKVKRIAWAIIFIKFHIFKIVSIKDYFGYDFCFARQFFKVIVKGFY